MEEPDSPPSHASEDPTLSTSLDDEEEEPRAVREPGGEPHAVREPGVEQRGQSPAGGYTKRPLPSINADEEASSPRHRCPRLQLGALPIDKEWSGKAAKLLAHLDFGRTMELANQKAREDQLAWMRRSC